MVRSYLSFDHSGRDAVLDNTYSGGYGISVGLPGSAFMGEIAGRVSWHVMRARFELQQLHRHTG